MHQAQTKTPAKFDKPAESECRMAHQAVESAHQPVWTHGQVVQPLVRLQTKLTINQPGDVYEQEADRVADQVMRMAEPAVQSCTCGGTTDSDGECEPCRAEKLSLQRKAASPTDTDVAVPPIVHDVLRSPGQPLDVHTRDFMEPRFGLDFSGVRVHTNAQAAESARAVNALAYTVGQDIVFGAGQYAPRTSSGRELLAHELAHAIQQKNSTQRLIQRRMIREVFATAALETGPVWNVTLIITNAPAQRTEAVEDFVNACHDGIRSAARSLGSGSGIRSRHLRVRIGYRPSMEYSAVSQEAFRLARQSVLGREASETEQAQPPRRSELEVVAEMMERGRGEPGWQPYRIEMQQGRVVRAERVTPQTSIPAESETQVPMAEQSIGAQLLAGAILGDFNEDQTFWTAVGQIIVGIIPVVGQIADIRDIIATLHRIIFQNGWRDIWEWLNLILILIGLIPLLGDIVKHAGRSGLRWLRQSGRIDRIIRWMGENLVRPAREAIAPLIHQTIARIKRELRALLDRINERVRRLTGQTVTDAERRVAQAARRYQTQLTEAMADAEARAARRGQDIMAHVRNPVNRSWINADPRQRELAFNPADRVHPFSDETVAEARAALAAESQGFVTPPLRRDLTGRTGASDFIDAAGTHWDVFTPMGRSVANDVDSILDKLTRAGQSVIFDASNVSPIVRRDIIQQLANRLVQQGQQHLLQRVRFVSVGLTEAELLLLRIGRVGIHTATREPTPQP